MADKSGTGADRRKRFEDEALPHLDALYSMAIRLARNPDDANDLLQETVLRAYRFFHQFESGTNCRAWMLTILFNNFRNGYRKSTREQPASSADEFERKVEAESLRIRPGWIESRGPAGRAGNGGRGRDRAGELAGRIPAGGAAGRRRGVELPGGFGGSERGYRYDKIASVAWACDAARKIDRICQGARNNTVLTPEYNDG